MGLFSKKYPVSGSGIPYFNWDCPICGYKNQKCASACGNCLSSFKWFEDGTYQKAGLMILNTATNRTNCPSNIGMYVVESGANDGGVTKLTLDRAFPSDLTTTVDFTTVDESDITRILEGRVIYSGQVTKDDAP